MEDSLEAPYFLKGLELRNWVYKVFQATWLDRLGLGSLDGISSEKECRQLNTSLTWNASTVSSFEQLPGRLQNTKPEKRKKHRPDLLIPSGTLSWKRLWKAGTVKSRHTCDFTLNAARANGKWLYKAGHQPDHQTKLSSRVKFGKINIW